MAKLSKAQAELKSYLTACGRLLYDTIYSKTYYTVINGVKKTYNYKTVWAVTDSLKEEGYIRKNDRSMSKWDVDACYFELPVAVSEPVSELAEIEITEQKLFMTCAPMFNFELDAHEIVDRAIEKGIIVKRGERLFIVDSDFFWFSEQ